jgi:hypothetical protein
MSKVKASDFYEFLDGNIEHANVFLDPATQDKTRLMKVISVTRKAGGRVARIGLNITQPKPRDIEIELDEALARAIVKVFDDAPEKPEPGLTMAQEREQEASEATTTSS